MTTIPTKARAGSPRIASGLALVRRTHWPVVAVLAIGLVATVLVCRWARSLDMVVAERQLRERGHSLVVELRERLQDSTLVLRGAAGLAAVTDELSRDDWRKYVAQLDINHQFPGIQGIGYAEWVTPETLKTHLRRARRDSPVDYALHPAGERAAYLPVTYLEPVNEFNQRALGFDMYAEATRRAAIERARDSGEIAATARIILLQESQIAPQLGFLLFRPLYAGGDVPDNAAARRAKLQGFAYAPFRMADLMAAVLKDNNQDLLIRVGDVNATAGSNAEREGELFDSAPGVNAAAARFSVQERLDFAGQSWQVSFHSTPVLEARVSRARSDVMGVAGLLLTFFAVVTTWMLSTARRRAENRAQEITWELRASQERFELAVRGANDGIWDRDLVSGKLYFSPRVEEFLGLAPGSLRDDPTEYAHRVHEEDRPRWRAVLRAHLRHNRPYDIEYRLRRADGSWGWFQSRGEAVRDKAGRALRMVGSLTDITARKESEMRLERYRAFLHRVLDSIPDPLAVKDDEHRYLIVNRAFADMVGREPDDIVGKTGYDIFPAERVDIAIDQEEAVVARGGSARQESLIPHASLGEPRNMIVTTVATVGPDGETMILSSGQDVTELRRAMARFASAIQDTPLVAVIGVRRDGTIDYWNDTAAAYYGYTAEEIVGCRVQTILATNELAQAHEAAIEEVWRTRQPMPPGEWKICLKNGSRRWVYATLFPVLLEGEVVELFIMAVDITARVEADHAIARANAQKKAVLDAATEVAIIATDLEGVITIFNPGAEKMLGYTADEMVGIHTPGKFNVAEEVIERGEQMSRRLGRTVSGFEIFSAAHGENEWTYVRKDGSRFTVSLVVTTMRDEADVIIGYLGVAVDVTERRQAEVALTRRNAIMQALIDNFPGGITLFDADYDMIACNEQFKRLFEFPDAMFEGGLPSLETLFRFDARRGEGAGEGGLGDEEEQVARRLEEARTQRVQPYLMERRRPNGVVVEIRGTPLPEGGFVTIYMDITERKAAEQKLRELSEVVRQSPVSIVITNLQGEIEYVNPKFERLTGYTLDDVRGMNPRFLKSGDKSATEYADLWRTIKSGREWHGELHNKKKNGDLYWEYASILPLVDEAGHITHFLAVKEDITERKRVDQELEMHRDHLRELVEEQTAGLLLAKEAAERAYRAKSEFLANVSHELRTPMHAILSFAQLGRDKAENAPREKLREYFGRVHMSGERLLALVNTLLDLSKLEAGKMLLDVRLLDITTVIWDVFGELEPLAAAKRQALVLVPPKEAAQANVDATRFAQVMRNLISNAIKFTPDGGRVAISIDPVMLAAGRRATDSGAVHALRITVSDAGIGIPEDELESIFDKFVQSKRTRSGAGGTGLGLAICREIVEAHGGSISAANNPQGGADLIVILPTDTARRKLPQPAADRAEDRAEDGAEVGAEEGAVLEGAQCDVAS